MTTVRYDNWEHGRRVFYSEFENFVCKYATFEVLAALAQTSAAMTEFSGFQQGWATVAPWTISGIARAAILTSNRSKGMHLDDKGFRRMANLFDQVAVNPDGSKFDAASFMTGKFYEQFPYQLSGKEDLTRPLSVLLETSVNFRGHKTKGDLDGLVGAPLEDLMNSTFVLYGLAKSSNGVITRSAIEAVLPQAPGNLPKFESIWATLQRLSATIEEARADALSVSQFKDGLQKLAYNPLTKTPFIKLNEDLYLAPQTFFILRSCSLENIYYLGSNRWPNTFGSDLGRRVEAYAGRQLRHTGDLEVHPEIEWNNKLSIDWFVVTPAATILIECKSAHVSLDVRVGAPTAPQIMASKLLPAYRQIEKTATELNGGNKAFAHIPTDRPLVALIVTAEPLYHANSDDVRDYLPETNVPTLTLSLRDLESLSTLPSDVLGKTLVQVANDPQLSRWDTFQSMKQILGDYRLGVRNKLIDAAYLKYVLPERLIPDQIPSQTA